MGEGFRRGEKEDICLSPPPGGGVVDMEGKE